ncbi:sigma-70 family RNA polymerase sigma factor [bacterium]|nr:sigma-70 family RNA polymerase sigma factor [candidate division CSSED10-310 bacterium]
MKSAISIMPERMMNVKIKLNDRTDSELVMLTLEGSTGAFGVLVERYRLRAVRMAGAIVGDWELARDLSQDSFLKAYRALSTFDVHSPFLPWFYRILRNTCMDQLRRKGRLRVVMDRIKQTAWNRGDLRDEISRSDSAVVVRMAVNRLREKDREIIELRHFSGLSYDEISEILDIPRGTVMSRLHYARKQLQDILVSEFHVKAGEI